MNDKPMDIFSVYVCAAICFVAIILCAWCIKNEYAAMDAARESSAALRECTQTSAVMRGKLEQINEWLSAAKGQNK